MVIDVKLVQLINAAKPIESIVLGNIIEVKFPIINAVSSIYVTL